jgi:hypothetical protein
MKLGTTERMLSQRIQDLRRRGDVRPLAELVTDCTKDLSAADVRKRYDQLVLKVVLRDLRDVTLSDNPAESEVALPLPFEPWQDAIGKYRTPPLLHVRRDGAEDFIAPDAALGVEVNKHDSWELLRRRRATAHVEKRKEHNLAHTRERQLLGFDPATETVHQMNARGDIRICVLCGEGPIAGDPWEQDHEQPVSTYDGKTPNRIGWAHRSCNRAKGATDLAHAARIASLT